MSPDITGEGATGGIETARPLGAALLEIVREAAERSTFRLWCRLLDVSTIDFTADPWRERVEPGALVEVVEQLQLAVPVLDQTCRRLSIAYFDAVGRDGSPDVPGGCAHDHARPAHRLER